MLTEEMIGHKNVDYSLLWRGSVESGTNELDTILILLKFITGPMICRNGLQHSIISEESISSEIVWQ